LPKIKIYFFTITLLIEKPSLPTLIGNKHGFKITRDVAAARVVGGKLTTTAGRMGKTNTGEKKDKVP
jgi:hypothetical protein